jgi:hypothetical protein
MKVSPLAAKPVEPSLLVNVPNSVQVSENVRTDTDAVMHSLSLKLHRGVPGR